MLAPNPSFSSLYFIIHNNHQTQGPLPFFPGGGRVTAGGENIKSALYVCSQRDPPLVDIGGPFPPSIFIPLMTNA